MNNAVMIGELHALREENANLRAALLDLRGKFDRDGVALVRTRAALDEALETGAPWHSEPRDDRQAWIERIRARAEGRQP
jgi:hypothetical protein